MGMVCSHLCVKLKVNIGCLPSQQSTLSFKRRSLSKPKDYPLITQTGHPSPAICLFLQGLILLSRLALQMYIDPLNFHVGSRNRNPHPRACTLHLPNHLSNFYALFFLIRLDLFILCVLLACQYVHYMSAWYWQKPEELVGPPELEIQMIFSHHIVLGTKPGSSVRATVFLMAEPSSQFL